MPAPIMLPINVTLEAPVVATFMRVTLDTKPTSKVTSFICVNNTFPDVVTANVDGDIMASNAPDLATIAVSEFHIVEAAALMPTTAPGDCTISPIPTIVTLAAPVDATFIRTVDDT